MIRAGRRGHRGRGYSVVSPWLCGFVPLLSGACAGDQPTFPDSRSADAAASDQSTNASVESSDSTAESSDSTAESSDSTAESSVSPGSGNNGSGHNGPESTDECPSGCSIDGTCYASGESDSNNPCAACDPDSSRNQWTNVDGETCDDGLYCTVGDQCSAGKCVGNERACDDGVACNGAETCDETQEACASAESTCDEGQTCDVENDECSSTCNGCVIDGSCYSDGAVSPSEPCMVCDSTAATNDWSVALAAACDDGDACTSDDRCNGAGACAGTPTVGGDCDCIDDSDCDDGVACTTDKCNDGTCSNTLQAGSCRIDEACVADGTADASNPCRYCDASSNQTGWTDSSPGASCDDGLWCNGADTCNAGSCTHEFPSGNRCAGLTGACETTSCNEGRKSCFQDDAHICRTETKVGCLENGCSSDVMSWEIDHYCRGDRANCSGGEQVSRESQATIYDNCQTEEICSPDTQECAQALECSGDVYCDESSELCWMSKDSVSTYTQAEAKTYCADLNFAGSSDWYLPSNDDARSVTRGCDGPSSCQEGEGPGIAGCYWPTDMGSCDKNLWLDNTMSGYWIPDIGAIGFTTIGAWNVRCVTAWPGR